MDALARPTEARTNLVFEAVERELKRREREAAKKKGRQ
jgi:hypothetical protein